jgi:hypothetical protein
MKTTILNLDYSLISIVSWQKGVVLMLKEAIQIIEYWPEQIRSGGGLLFSVPKIVMVKEFIYRHRRLSPRKKNILMRDFYECQYCASKESLTIDHVVPKSKGGKDTWENLVTACQKCNSRKGNRTPDEADMKLRKIPKQPY